MITYGSVQGERLFDDPWWEIEDDDAEISKAVLESAESIIADTFGARIAMIKKHRSMYKGTYVYEADGYGDEDLTMGLNYFQSMIDTLVANLTKSFPQPTLLTIGESDNFSAKERSKLVNKWRKGLFSQQNFYDVLTQAIEGAMKADGYLHIYRQGNEIKTESPDSATIVVDDKGDGKYGKPKIYYQYLNMDRQTAYIEWPEHREAIRNADKQNQGHSASNNESDKIRVVVATKIAMIKDNPIEGKNGYLEAVKETTPGRRIVAIDGAIIQDEEWLKPYGPYLKLSYLDADPGDGYYGSPMGSLIAPVQEMVDKVSYDLILKHHFGAPYWIAERGSEVQMDNVASDGYYRQIQYSGTPPQLVFPESADRSTMEYMAFLLDSMHAIPGISKLAAQQELPRSLESGTAINNYYEIGQDRFIKMGRKIEKIVINALHRYIDLAKEIAEDYGEYKVKLTEDDFGSELDFAELNLEDDAFIIDVAPTNYFSGTPSAKIDKAERIVALDPSYQPYIAGMLGFPDLEGVTDVINAPMRTVEFIADRILNHGELIQFEPFHPLEIALQVLPLYYTKASTDGAPRERLDALAEFLVQAQKAQQALMAPEPPQPGALPSAESAAGSAVLPSPNGVASGGPQAMGGVQ